MIAKLGTGVQGYNIDMCLKYQHKPMYTLSRGLRWL